MRRLPEKGLKVGQDRLLHIFSAARTMLDFVSGKLSRKFRDLAERGNQMNRMSVIVFQYCRQNTSTLWKGFTHFRKGGWGGSELRLVGRSSLNRGVCPSSYGVGKGTANQQTPI